jgi:hypothetical protein
MLSLNLGGEVFEIVYALNAFMSNLILAFFFILVGIFIKSFEKL